MRSDGRVLIVEVGQVGLDGGLCGLRCTRSDHSPKRRVTAGGNVVRFGALGEGEV